MVTFQEVLTAAKNLTQAEQLSLAEAIWEQLSPSEWPMPSEEWIEEVQRRSALYDAGQMTISSWPEVQARARKKVGLSE